MSFMRCRTARRWMTTELAGELTRSRIARRARHVERCTDCEDERAAYAALERALDALPLEVALPPRLEQDALRRVRLEAAREDGARPPGLAHRLRLAAP